MKNVKMTREDSIKNFESIIDKAKENGVLIRYNISTSFWCPYEGKVNSSVVLEMVERIDRIGVDEIVICDTIGRANPAQVYDLFQQISSRQHKAVITAHFHDTYGLAQANIIATLQTELRGLILPLEGWEDVRMRRGSRKCRYRRCGIYVTRAGD